MTVLEDVPVRHLPTERRPGAENMALDAVSADRAASDGLASVRVYGWSPSTLSLGYAQDPATVDWGFCEQAGIHVTRRPTGGGGIYHDRYGDIAYSIVAPREALPEDLMESYRLLCEPVVEAMRELGVPVGFTDIEREARYEPACYLRALNPSHDLVVTDERGTRKVSGNAQYRRKSAIVQHGSIRFENRPRRHVSCFADDDLSPEAFGERVTAIAEHTDVDWVEGVTALEDNLRAWSGAGDGEWTESDKRRMRALVDEQFGSKRWIQDREKGTPEA